MAPEPHRHTVADEHAEVRNPVEARQGFLDRPVLAILVTSIVLLLAAYALIVGFW